ncbi:MAG: hypothetical protein EZS28_028085 [Streblomastix strix]|uniref:Uncharacterized protein n=1 Tax=Streblomastix strix TaxID=222440 RepID=A0A5J4V0Y7_9EUKA|nr:MAG: hypothetical protein EZS28_028085 [Streblomastix strix]
MLVDIEETYGLNSTKHPHTSKVRIPRITAVPELRVVAAASNNQGKYKKKEKKALLLLQDSHVTDIFWLGRSKMSLLDIGACAVIIFRDDLDEIVMTFLLNMKKK